MKKMDESKNAILEGYAKYYGDIVEYDIIFKFGNETDLNEMHIFDSTSELSANIVKFDFARSIGTNSNDYNENYKHF